MSEAVIEVGDKIHVVTRRLFDGDSRRHFVGEVVSFAGDFTALRGNSFLFQTGMNEFRRLPEPTTRLLSLGDAGFVVNKLPREVDLLSLSYQVIARRLVLTDGRAFSLPISEFSSTS